MGRRREASPPPIRCASLPAKLRITGDHNVSRYITSSVIIGQMHDAILDFWFGRPGTTGYGTTRDFWFRKDPALDAALRARFGAAIETALAGGFADWASPRGALARIVLLDQVTRNVFRDTPRAFAGDAPALRLARELADRGDDRSLIAVERWFAYMPFVHAEATAAQERAVELFRRLRDETGLADRK